MPSEPSEDREFARWVTLPVSEIKVIERNRILLLGVVSIFLVVNGDPVPVAGSRIFRIAKGVSLSIQRDRLK